MLTLFNHTPLKSNWNFLFDELFGDLEIGFHRIPLAHTICQDNKYILCLEVPGFNEKDIQIKVQNDKLIVRGKHEITEEEIGYKSEQAMTLNQIYTIPSDISQDKIEAKLKNGILNIIMPKIIDNKQKLKEIPIKV